MTLKLYCLFTSGVREVMGSIPFGDSEFFSVPHSCHVDHFITELKYLPSYHLTYHNRMGFVYYIQYTFLHYVNSLRRENDVTEPRKVHDWERTR